MTPPSATYATAAATGLPPSLDPETFARLRRWGGEKLVHDLLHLFRAYAPERISALRIALVAGSAARAGASAHALRSSCGQLGATRMAELCAHVERLTADDDLGGITGAADELERELGLYLLALGGAGVVEERAA